MRTILKLAVALAAVSLLIACNNSMGEPDSRLAAVETLIEPATGKAVVLSPSATVPVIFEWNYVDVSEGGTVIYEIAFDKPDGDFSAPVYRMMSSNSGYKNSVSLTHKQLNKIAGMAGISASAAGNLKWTVFTSKGTGVMKSLQENTLNVTRLAGFEDIPVDVYVTGEASEGGADLAKAHRMKAIASGEFEVYTQLKAGESFHFTDGVTGTPKVFYTADGLIKENGTSTVATGGIYRIELDFNTGAASYTLVTKITFYFSPSGASLFELPYAGYGVFRATATVTFKEEGWGRDQRYKFRMFVKTNGGADAETELEWGTLNGTDSPPAPTSPESYYYLQLLEGDGVTQWDNKWKLMSEFDGVEAVYTVRLTADTPYTHSVALN